MCKFGAQRHFQDVLASFVLEGAFASSTIDLDDDFCYDTSIELLMALLSPQELRITLQY